MQGLLHQCAVAECGGDDAAFDIEIAGPSAAVAFDRVPDAVLHAEMGGVGAGLPDAVQQRIGGLERTGVGDRVVDAFHADGLERGDRCAAQEADAHVAEAGLGTARGAVCGDFEKIGSEIVAALLAGREAGCERFDLGLSIGDGESVNLRGTRIPRADVRQSRAQNRAAAKARRRRWIRAWLDL